MNSAKFEIDTVPANAAERVRAIRFRLPGQAVRERIEMARVAYGPCTPSVWSKPNSTDSPISAVARFGVSGC
jgi:hypothetical protein